MAKRLFWDAYVNKEEFEKEMQRFYDQFTGEKLAVMMYPVASDIQKTFRDVIEKKKLIWRRELYESVEIDLTSVSRKEIVYNIMPKVPYAYTLEKGLPHVANIDKLRQWVLDKMTSDKAEAEKITFMLYKRFKEQGAKPHPYFEEVIDILKRRIIQMVRRRIYEHLMEFRFKG